MKDGEDPSIVDPDYGKFAKEQETKGRRHSQKDINAERFAAPVDQGPPPNEDPAYAKVIPRTRPDHQIRSCLIAKMTSPLNFAYKKSK